MAIYHNGKLIALKSMCLLELIGIFRTYEPLNPVLHIEHVCGNNAAFVHRKKFTLQSSYDSAVKSRNRKLGMCQQAQIEVERAAEYYGIDIARHKISKSWKKDSGMFRNATGWQGRSNEDTRSAAYFGMLGCK